MCLCLSRSELFSWAYFYRARREPSLDQRGRLHWPGDGPLGCLFGLSVEMVSWGFEKYFIFDLVIMSFPLFCDHDAHSIIFFIVQHMQ